VARITVFAPIDFSPPSSRSQAITPWQRSSFMTSFQAKYSSYAGISRFITCS
jgi:hypothetical protein